MCVNGLFDALPWAAFAVCVLPAAGFCLQFCCWPGCPEGGGGWWHPRCLEIQLKVRVQPAHQGVGLEKYTFWFQGGGKHFMRLGNTTLRPFSTGILASPSPGVYGKCGFPVALWGEIGISGLGFLGEAGTSLCKLWVLSPSLPSCLCGLWCQVLCPFAFGRPSS